jgi:hypothetical protein
VLVFGFDKQFIRAPRVTPRRMILAINQFSSVQFSSVQFSSIQFSSVQFSSVQFSSVQFSSVQSAPRGPLHYPALFGWTAACVQHACGPIVHLLGVHSLANRVVYRATTHQRGCFVIANHALCHCTDDATHHCRPGLGSSLTMHSVTALMTPQH